MAFGDSNPVGQTSIGSQIVQAWVTRKSAVSHPDHEITQTASYAMRSEVQLESQNGRIDTQIRLQKLVRREKKLPLAEQNAPYIKSLNSQIKSYAKQAKAEAKAAAAQARK